jgi:tetratricopeptide (TPR) repeat protein
MSKTLQLLLAALALIAFAPAVSLAQSGEVVADAVSYSRSFSQGVEHFDAGRYEEALEAFLAAVVLNPRDPDALFDVGATYERLGRPLEASAAFRSVVELRPASAKARAPLLVARGGGAVLGRGRDARVTAELSDMERDLGSVEGYDRLLNVGHAYRMKGWYRKAVAAYALAARKRPRDAQALYYVGLTYYSMNQYYRALDWYGRALAADPKMAEARRDFDWLSSYLSGGAYGGKGGACGGARTRRGGEES